MRTIFLSHFCLWAEDLQCRLCSTAELNWEGEVTVPQCGRGTEMCIRHSGCSGSTGGTWLASGSTTETVTNKTLWGVMEYTDQQNCHGFRALFIASSTSWWDSFPSTSCFCLILHLNTGKKYLDFMETTSHTRWCTCKSFQTEQS